MAIDTIYSKVTTKFYAEQIGKIVGMLQKKDPRAPKWIRDIETSDDFEIDKSHFKIIFKRKRKDSILCDDFHLDWNDYIVYDILNSEYTFLSEKQFKEELYPLVHMS